MRISLHPSLRLRVLRGLPWHGARRVRAAALSRDDGAGTGTQRLTRRRAWMRSLERISRIGAAA
jgi:hypothetical protein